MGASDDKEKGPVDVEAVPAKEPDDAAAAATKKTDAACKFITSTLKSLTELNSDSGCNEAAAAEGGRRRKRSARKGRRSRKGGRKSRGCKGRRSRGRARTIKGGVKMSKELKAWMERQKKATGITAISKKTIDATKTKTQATGSEQRSESGKHVAAKQRNL